MSDREFARGTILRRVVAGELTIREATPLLRVSYRQAKRLVQRFRAGGRKGLVHRCPRTTPASPCRPQVSSITIGRAIPAAWQTPMCSASRRRASWATITWCSIRIGRCSSSAARGGECRRRAKSSCAKCATARFASYTSPGMAASACCAGRRPCRARFAPSRLPRRCRAPSHRVRRAPRSPRRIIRGAGNTNAGWNKRSNDGHGGTQPPLD
jgi:hypothetical protein